MQTNMLRRDVSTCFLNFHISFMTPSRSFPATGQDDATFSSTSRAQALARHGLDFPISQRLPSVYTVVNMT